MIAAICRGLANTAARRFPPDSQVRDEWLAELDYLATHGHPLRGLRFAAGLAFVRPAHAPVIGFTKPTVGTALSILAGPLALLLIALGIGISLGYRPSPVLLWVLFAAMLAMAASAGWWWGARSVVAGPFPLSLLLTAAIAATLWLPLLGAGTALGNNEFVVGAAVWLPALPLALLAVGRLAQVRRSAVVVVGGFVAWLAVLDVAVTADFLSRQTAARGDALTGHAPFWFVHALTGQSFGVLSPSEELLIQETYFPHALVIFALYAMCYTARACRNA